MADRKKDPQQFPTRGTPSGYREIWDADDSAIMEAQIAERERQSVAAHEAAAAVRRRRGLTIGETPMRPPNAPAEIVTDL